MGDERREILNRHLGTESSVVEFEGYDEEGLDGNKNPMMFVSIEH